MTFRYLVLVCASVAAAPAATISFTFVGEVNNSSVRRSLDSGATYTNQSVGQMSITVTGSTGIYGSLPASFYTFCIEPQEGVSAGTSYTYTVKTLESSPSNVAGGMGSVKADLLRELYAQYYPDPTVSLSVVNASALQLATWEIVRETTGAYNVSSGSVRFQDATTPNPNFASIISTANAMLAAITPVGGVKLTNLWAISFVGNQDLAFNARTATIAPEPGTVGLAAVGLLVAWRQRRRIQW